MYLLVFRLKSKFLFYDVAYYHGRSQGFWQGRALSGAKRKIVSGDEAFNGVGG